jgi:hypothetical protein
MGWVPDSAWLTKIEVDASPAQLGYDLAIDASGQGTPSRVQAGLDLPAARAAAPGHATDGLRIVAALVTILAGTALIGLVMTSRSGGSRAAPG